MTSPLPYSLKKKKNQEIAVGNDVWVVDSSDQGSLHVGLERNLTQYQPHGVGGGGVQSKGKVFLE